MNNTGCASSGGDADAAGEPTNRATIVAAAATTAAAHRRTPERSGVVGNDLDRAESGGLEISHHCGRVTDDDAHQLIRPQP